MPGGLPQAPRLDRFHHPTVFAIDERLFQPKRRIIRRAHEVVFGACAMPRAVRAGLERLTPSCTCPNRIVE